MKKIIANVWRQHWDAACILICFIPMLAIACFVPGCTSTQTPSVTQSPVYVPALVTNQLQTVNPATGLVTTSLITNTVTVTNFVPVTNLVTTYAVNTNLINTIGTGATIVAGIASAANPAIAPVANVVIPWGVALATTIAGAIAAYLNQKNKGVAASIIAGVEAASPAGNDNAPVSVAAVKASVQNTATLNGNLPAVHAAVVSNT